MIYLLTVNAMDNTSMSMNHFKPAWWLPNSHLQTLWPVFCRRSIKDLPLKRERVELPDGDFIDLDWAGSGKGPLVLVLHGFEGSIESHYSKGLLRAICEQGWRGVFMHFRGCSGEPNRLSRSYHSGETDDVAAVVKIIREREPDTLLAAIGVSLGGNILLKWLGETKQKSPLKAAIAISVPFELYKAVLRIQHGLSRAYQWYFLKCVCDRLTQKSQKVPSTFDPSLLSQLHTMFEFDDKVTAPLHGFTDVHEYYATVSSRRYLRDVRVPTLILHAKDDPFMTEDMIPKPQELSKHIKLELTETGGHVGFVSGKYPWRPEYWLEQRIPLFLRDYLRK